MASILYPDGHLSMSARNKTQEQSEVVPEPARLLNIFGKWKEYNKENDKRTYTAMA